MEENQKQQQYNLIIKCQNVLFYTMMALLSGNLAFAENKEEEFFDAAMQVDAPMTKEALQNAGTVVEQNMAAEQIGEKSMNSGTNILLNIQNSLQSLGHNISDKMEQLTGGNPLIAKVLVVLFLVFVSVLVIVVLVLIAKKFIFKPRKEAVVDENGEEYEETDEYEEDDDEFDTSKFDEEDEEIITDEDDDFEDADGNVTPIQQEETPAVQPQPQPQTAPPVSKPAAASGPLNTIDDAIKVFLEVTEF